ncbi:MULTISPECIES: phosphoribosylformylglycinamidine synthase I [Metallosphaera]|uniref:Phosphoribosylformylglycinamidine synthase subunit PurQ n=3 Tax=Metallosphaera TaxID=41980 RepID=A4YI67_METS5|nr:MULTISPECIES: phosphoribosylformylglycinamidine synthase I [Metallosphaera]ABP96119.1 phosphoribosylformylglycinamidine synthase subunit I [Metallosphaera sedula DSM 5348]AIM28102.1 phosphoribosylformylglycinamidine synthase subunit I [Metallosphaera sedula]AKV74928.1 phosphoribosylformylglycinamidine synthase [Metallosphaera sedula]AKV77166.1 phosphoribosylformylglycinamidine synthase [Metallosphaera sedula]AKV79416.1 phosphoribosylformylglycinamidine synthase [Metallosphaera sedula]
MRTAVIKFPGTTCELDVVKALKQVGAEAEVVKFNSLDPDRYDGVVIPGGFSFGDYLRAGTIAANSEAMKGIREMADQGKLVLGICNGFQILVESGLLKGALLPNLNLRFITKWVRIRVRRKDTPFTKDSKDVLFMPIAHAEGRYYLDDEELASRLSVFQYVDERGMPSPQANPNGSILNIAGVTNEAGNVLGLMPHPERASFPSISPDGSRDGLEILRVFGK